MRIHILRLYMTVALTMAANGVALSQQPAAQHAIQHIDELDFVKYTAREGLSNSHVNAIGQDKHGFIWVGTNNGLNRLDGQNIETFHRIEGDSSSINSNTVYTIFTDRQERVWFGTFAGVCRYDYESGLFKRYTLPSQPNTVRYVPIRGIAQTDDGDIWLATSGGGLAIINAQDDKVTYLRHDDEHPANSIASDFLQSVATDDLGNVWLGSENNGISIYDPKTHKHHNINKKSGLIGSNLILTLYKSRDGRMWIGTYEGGVTVYDPKDSTFTTHKLTDDGASVYGIAEDKDGNIWLGTQESGLFKLTQNGTHHYAIELGNVTDLISDNIHALYTDKDSNLWLGVFQGGVNMAKPAPPFGGINHRKSNTSTGLSHRPVLSIYPDTKEKVYIGTDGDGINIWNTVTNHVDHIRTGHSGLKSNIIRSIFKDHDGRIWVGTYLKGLQEFHPKTMTLTGYENIPGDSTSLSHNDITCITEDRLGNLWIGTNGGGLNLLDKATGKFYSYRRTERQTSNSIINDHLTGLYVDLHGYLWICTYWGLSRMDPVKRTVRNFELQEGHNTYFCVYEDSKQRFWAGTTAGLKLMDIANGSFYSFTMQDGLPNNVVSGITEDSEGNLWLTTDQGLCKFNYDKKTIVNYFIEDGLISNEFMHNSIATDTDGEIYCGSVEGVTKFYPENISTENIPPRITIVDLLVFNKKVTPGDSRGILQKSMSETSDISLQWSDNSFTIVYKAIDYVQPQKIMYASRMRGFDSEWHYNDYNRNSASYTNLDAGVYHFEVKASTDGKTWSEPVVLKINIIAPAWRRWWAILAYIATFAIAVQIVWRYYRRTEQEKQKIKIEYIKQQNDIELNKTRLQLFTDISHEFRTPLTLLISPLEKMLDSKQYDGGTMARFNLMHRNALRLLRLVNQVMDIRKIDADKMQLTPVKDDIVKFTREICENFLPLAESHGIDLQFHSEMGQQQAYFDHEMIDKSLYNLLSNAFKFTPDNGKIEVSIRRAIEGSTNFVIIVEDNGRGIAPENIDRVFDRFYQGGISNIQQGSGIGLWLTKEFIEMHHGIISVSSELGKGTAFTIMLTDGEEFKDMAAATGEYKHPSIGTYTEHEIPQPKIEIVTDKITDSPQSTLLIVEDNDDIRQYLRDGLSKMYSIKTATNGTDGLETARTTLPDLVITDIMMPGMNGIDLCRTLKTDIDTCHIPVIMLTAKSSEEQRIEGLETGADSYIPKPFNPKHLLVRIEKLLELRKTLREKFGNEINFDAVQTAVTTPDRDLLKKVTDVIRKRISDTSLSVETLAEEVGLSRGHLQRKLKSLTGQNPNEFIRIIRLKYAAELLTEKTEMSIAEVADLVGFNSQSYFSTAFTKQFNISPSQYKEEANQAGV